MVAHPDDCIIYAYGFIKCNPQFDWKICYLTHQARSPRGYEMTDFWTARSIPVKFLGFEDLGKDIETDTLSFDTVAARNAIRLQLYGKKIVLTHNEYGDYGHIHHKFVYHCCRQFPRLATFLGNDVCRIQEKDHYDFNEIPLHYKKYKEVVKSKDIYKYNIPNSIRNLINLTT